MEIREALVQLIAGRTLSSDQADALFESLLTGALDPVQIGALLALIQSRSASVDEVVGAARAMRRHVTRVPAPDVGAVLVDTCGTGGAPKTFNVSTAAAIVAAAAAPGRIMVAKHGNRSRTGRGSAEVLQKLGVNVDASPETQAECLRVAGVCFSFAIRHHPAMKHAAAPRQALGVPTIFNLLGPLTNPAGARRQLLGVYAPHLVDLMAAALAQLGAERAMVVHGLDGMDEISITGRTRIAHVRNGVVTNEELDARTLGVSSCALADLSARDLDHAAAIIRDVFEGKRGPCRDIVALNAAAALAVADATPDLKSALAAATDAIDSGQAKCTLADLVAVSNRPSPDP